MLGVLGDEHMGDGAICRQAALDQPGRLQGLGDAPLARPAGVFRANRDDHCGATINLRLPRQSG